MKSIAIVIIITAFTFGCNTKMGSNEPTNDSKLNPAELPVDSVGAGTDMQSSSAADSNKTGDPMRGPGKSDLQVGEGDASGKAISSDGNIVDEKKNNSN